MRVRINLYCNSNGSNECCMQMNGSLEDDCTPQLSHWNRRNVRRCRMSRPGLERLGSSFDIKEWSKSYKRIRHSCFMSDKFVFMLIIFVFYSSTIVSSSFVMDRSKYLPLSLTTSTPDRFSFTSVDGTFRDSNILLLRNFAEMKGIRKTSLFMGKGDGKKQRKKKSANSSTRAVNGDSNVESEQQPLRVTSNSVVSVRRQIAWARAKKERASSGTSFRNTKARTAFRKKVPVGPDELAEARKARKEKATDDWAVLTNGTSAPLVRM